VLPDLGSRIERLAYRGRDVLRRPDDESLLVREPTFWGSFVMAPWCNRIEADHAVRVGRRTLRVPANFPDGTAIHGQVFDRVWQVAGAEMAPDAVTLAVDVSAAVGWPWSYEVTQRIAVLASSVRDRKSVV